ncbi:MAG TPA: c-type cytochrome [Gaiellaceae bacterium]|jgi:ubiquinol-cytochrome c reductase cytochrome c subunit
MRTALLVALASLLAAPATLADSGPPRQGVTHARSGAALYAANCASCHGPHGEGVPTPYPGAGGVPGQGPALRGVGARAADFYLRTGYMPLEDPGQQPTRSRVLFTERELSALVGFVASLGGGPPVPQPHPERGSVAVGQKLFVDHCAGCHQVVAEGGYVTGARVPPLEDATDRQIAEAVRIGPYLMPRFTRGQISPSQLDSLIAYVDYAKHPDDAGGWSLGHLGPWPEGVVTWLIAAASLVALCVVIGRRLPS